jgi:4-hydroxy 2-oxovalerate aldolase
MVNILDTTLRDGSYVVDFKITALQTSKIAGALDDTGVDYIEIGHGLGLNAGTFDHMKGACCDEEYLEAASSVIRRAKWGTFFIPGIGRKEDIDLAARYKMPMIRIGANINEYSKAEPFIRYAKEKGMFVCANFMKTYALGYDEVGEIAGKAAEFGADLLCIVDSAGSMLPGDVTGYVKAIRNNSDKQLGFHGHNNLGMAIMNTVQAIEEKVEVVDTSLRGMGRSAGNTVTEILVLVLKRMGIDLGYDILKLMDIAEKYIDPLMAGYAQVDSFSILSGYAKFHSSFQPKIELFAKKYSVDPRRLLIKVCEKDCINASDKLVDEMALELSVNHEKPV